MFAFDLLFLLFLLFDILGLVVVVFGLVVFGLVVLVSKPSNISFCVLLFIK